MKITSSITATLFVGFTGFLLIARFVFGLYHSRISFLFLLLFIKKEDAFQKKNEQLPRSRCRYFLPFSIGSHFQEICISLLPNIFYVSYIDLLTRADNYFISSKQLRAVLKTYLFYKRAFYNVKCSYFALTLP